MLTKILIIIESDDDAYGERALYLDDDIFDDEIFNYDEIDIDFFNDDSINIDSSKDDSTPTILEMDSDENVDLHTPPLIMHTNDSFTEKEIDDLLSA